MVVDILIQKRRNIKAAQRLKEKLLKKSGFAPRVIISDKLKSYDAACRELGLSIEHRLHQGLNNQAENSHQWTRLREKQERSKGENLNLLNQPNDFYQQQS